MEVQFQVLSDDECAQNWSNRYNKTTTVCAGNNNDGKGTCDVNKIK